MRLLCLLLILISSVCAKEIMDLGNLDIKGNLNLPSYKLNSDVLSLDESLKKIAKIEYDIDSQVESIDEKKQIKNGFQLIDEDDLSFDIKVQKKRLE